MKLKLDENLGERGREILQGAGHDVASVSQEKLEGKLWIVELGRLRVFQEEEPV